MVADMIVQIAPATVVNFLYWLYVSVTGLAYKSNP